MKDEKPRFTEADSKALEQLPENEIRNYSLRLGRLEMRRRIADDAWETEIDDIAKDADLLFGEIKERLAGVIKK